MYLILVTEDGRGSGETWMGFENIFPIQRVSFFARNCFTRKMEKREEEKQNLFYRLQVSGMHRGPTARAGKAIRRGGHAHKRKRDGSHHRAKVENFARTKKLKRVRTHQGHGLMFFFLRGRSSSSITTAGHLHNNRPILWLSARPNGLGVLGRLA